MSLPSPFSSPPGRRWRLRGWTLGVFVATAALYFLTRTPALDEWDSVQFAQGVGDFNLWRHHPHPPGYPLYIAAGWTFQHLPGWNVQDALQLASALGGGLFVACWFALAAQAFGRWVGGLCAVALGGLLITWMTATKVLTDGLGSGLLALTLLLAGNGRLVPAALAGAAAVGVRPQTFPVLLFIVVLAIIRERPRPRRWLAGLGSFFGGCLAWLLPTMFLQTRTPESDGSFLTYPAQLLSQWRWRLDQPKAFIGAATHGQSFLAYRLDHHLLGLLTRGFGFPVESVWGWLGIAVLVLGWTFYGLGRRRRIAPETPSPHRRFWTDHLPWALLYAGIVFCCLPGDQRYYLPVFPLLLLPAILGWAEAWSTPGTRWLAAVVPAATLCATLPLVAENHREPAPPVQMLRWLRSRYAPPEQRRVCLLLRDGFRHAQWYAPGFPLVNLAPFPRSVVEPAPSENPGYYLAVYADDPAAPMHSAGRWELVSFFERSARIYRKHHEAALYRWVPYLADGVGHAERNR